MQASIDGDKIMEFTLRHVPFDGWTETAYKRGAHDAGIPEDQAVLLFGHKPTTLLEYYSHMLDRKMLEALDMEALNTMKIRDRIATCVMTRLEIMAPHREAAQKAAVLLSLPLNAPLASRLLFKTVDTIWYACGDNASDFNYYTKRGLLSLVYSSTLLYWFRDLSEGYSLTRDFLNRRIENVMVIPKVKSQIINGLNNLKEFFGQAKRK